MWVSYADSLGQEASPPSGDPNSISDTKNPVIDYGWISNNNNYHEQDKPRKGYGFTGCPCSDWVEKWVDASRNDAFETVLRVWGAGASVGGPGNLSVADEDIQNQCGDKYEAGHARENATYLHEIADNNLVCNPFTSVIRQPSCHHGEGSSFDGVTNLPLFTWRGMSDFPSYYSNHGSSENPCTDGQYSTQEDCVAAGELWNCGHPTAGTRCYLPNCGANRS